MQWHYIIVAHNLAAHYPFLGRWRLCSASKSLAEATAPSCLNLIANTLRSVNVVCTPPHVGLADANLECWNWNVFRTTWLILIRCHSENNRLQRLQSPSRKVRDASSVR